MTQIVTDAIVLHAFDYLESSRILRMVTREAGVRSVLARGARKSGKRFGAALDLYTQGTADLQTKPGRDLDTLAAFDVARVRHGIAGDLARFAGASMIAELTLRSARDVADPDLFDAVEDALDALTSAAPDRARDAALAGAWRILAEVGVGPAIDDCAECHSAIDPTASAMFSPRVGGTLCDRCGRLARAGRMLPATARDALRAWLGAESHAVTDANEIRAHQRVLREFVREHLDDDRPLNAFDVWERGTLDVVAPAGNA
ncbi:MAG TPA: DNA repair protein RecO [Gemmatimonadaceae bacterium]|jgi:DNA repair protein RecO (recombination protein O)